MPSGSVPSGSASLTSAIPASARPTSVPSLGRADVPVGRFPPAQRVRKRPEFQRIQSQGRRLTTAHFILLVLARDLKSEHSTARLGVTVSRRVGSSVVRSRAKRLVREAFRATRELWPSDVDLVVIVRTMTAGLKLTHVIAEWRTAERALRRRVIEARRDRDAGQSPLAREP